MVPTQCQLGLINLPPPFTVTFSMGQPVLLFLGLPNHICLTWGQDFFNFFGFFIGNRTVLKLRSIFRNGIDSPFQWQFSKIAPYSPITILFKLQNQQSLENVKAFIITIKKGLFGPVLRREFNEPVHIPWHQDFSAMYCIILETEIQVCFYHLYYRRGSLIL